MYDIIVVGARCAGSPLAMLLARKGYRVLLVDKATFPSDTLSTHTLTQSAVIQLQRWGLLNRLAATDTPPIHTQTLDAGSIVLRGSATGHVAPDYAPRRYVLDSLLLDAAVEAGAEVRMGFQVQELVWEGNRVVGIRGRTPGGALVTERAPLVIGADGKHSFVARSVQASTYDTHPARTCCYYSYWSGVPVEDMTLYVRDRCDILAWPTNQGLTLVGMNLPQETFHAFRTNIEGNFLGMLKQVPQLAERVRAGQREERFMGTADLPFFFRQSHGAGWALVGDAGSAQDSIGGLGMSNAFRDAELLAEAIDVGLSGNRLLATTLAGYEQRRNEATRPMYEFIYGLAALEPLPPGMQRLFAALQGKQPATDRLFGVLGGTVSLAEFFAPGNIERIMAGAELAKVAA
ncbi:MAG TPA: NAD(P)/FAD-dependent oxidoreductase [Ktedonobacteraceae bacterium]